MKHARRNLLVAVASTVLVAVLVMAIAERPSPGPVSSVHAGLERIDGGESCAACHGGLFGDMRSACSECHEDVAAQLEAGDGLHGRLDVALVGNCSTCHSEHHGGGFRLVNRLAFAQAGVADPAAFDHHLVGYEMAGKHLELQCVECHAHADDVLLAAGDKRFLGLEQACSSCHEDPHAGRMQLGCVTCHSQDGFATRDVHDHDRWLALDGRHGQLGCRDCHGADDAHALERLPGDRGAARGCADCHEGPHSAPFLANSTPVGERQVDNCARCHAPAQDAFAAATSVMTPALHEATGFALAAPHDAVACAKCHDATLPFTERHPGRDADACAACHADVHDGQFDDGAFSRGEFGARGCLACHDRAAFAPHAFDREHHAHTALPLDGRHAEADCSACHADPAEGAARRFVGTPTRCEQCHDDSHRAAFAGNAARLAAAPRGACAVCHGTAAWRDVEHARFDHGDWTGFVVDGAHGQIDCADCHPALDQPEPDGRSFGRVPAHQDGAAVCTACHGDPHRGIFDRDGRPAEVDGRAGCVRCHDTASFRALLRGFDHGAFTGFQLAGKHGEQPCSACHEPLAVADATGRTWGEAKGRACADCHADPHRQQFERRGATDCARCHKSTTTFAALTFRHNLDSRFPIEEQHQKVACARCHQQEHVDGITFVRYRPLPVQCVDCHGREEGGATSRRRRR
ncbi:MAG: hypothetical protein H6835_15805 [Planctomycetes bacterium]|nr:hypothetical protein [Planctomycetota bacterium]